MPWEFDEIASRSSPRQFGREVRVLVKGYHVRTLGLVGSLPRVSWARSSEWVARRTNPRKLTYEMTSREFCRTINRAEG